jgi:hypothetical protein
MQKTIADRAKCVTADRGQGGQGRQLKFVPILGRSHERPPYELLREETLAFVKVTELSESGSVPELRVTNDLDVAVFLMDGQELVGAKQNRILNTDVLVPAKATLTIPVSCVEAHRWHHVSPSFSSGKSASHRIRSAKLARVSQSLKTGGGHNADQTAVWAEVQASMDASGTSSPTAALSDAYTQRESALAEVRKDLRLPKKAVGLAVFQAGRFQGLDLFDRHSTLKYFWESLVDSYAIDLLGTPVDPGQPESDEGQVVRSVLDKAVAGEWEAFNPPGEGKEWRLETDDFAAASLVWNDEVVIHLQVFPKVPVGDVGAKAVAYKPRIRRRYGAAGQ